MIHFGKTPQGELQINLTGSDIDALQTVIRSAGLLERRTFYGLSQYIKENFNNNSSI